MVTSSLSELLIVVSINWAGCPQFDSLSPFCQLSFPLKLIWMPLL